MRPRLGALWITIVLVITACGLGTEASPEPTDDESPATPDATGSPEAPVDEGYRDGDVVTLVVPTDPGGGIDTQARLIQPFVQDQLREITGTDVQVVVQNVPGGAQLVGIEQVWRSEPDGMTFLYHLTNVMLSHQVLGGADFDVREMTALGRLTILPTGLIVRQDLDLPERSLTGLIERSQQEAVLLGNVGDPVEVELLVRMLAASGLDFNAEVVQLDGTSDIIASLLRQEIEVGKTTSVGAIPAVEDNPDELEFLVTLGCEREAALPDVPSIAEEDIEGVEEICESIGASHRLFLGPPGMSEAHANQLTAALEAAVADPEFREQLAESGAEPAWESPDAIAALLENLVETWQEHSEGLGQ